MTVFPVYKFHASVVKSFVSFKGKDYQNTLQCNLNKNHIIVGLNLYINIFCAEFPKQIAPKMAALIY